MNRFQTPLAAGATGAAGRCFEWYKAAGRRQSSSSSQEISLTARTLLDDLPAFFTRALAHISAAETPDDKRDGWHVDQQAYRPFPELATGRFASILDDVAGFSP